MNFLAQTTLRANAKTVTHQKHAYHQFWINRWPACMAVMVFEVLTDKTKIRKFINRTY